jgi:glycerol-3-phosphate O-acyltransferase
MLSMILGSFYRDSKKPIALMPVYLGYDKVPEVATYLSELGGKKKSKESMRQFFNLFQILRMKFGKAYIGFGEPIMLEDYLNEHQPNWQADADQSDGHPIWHSQIVRALADETQRRVNSAAIINPVSMFAVVMLSTPTKAMAEDELIYLMDSFIHALRVIPYSEDVTLQEGTGKEFLEQAMNVCRVGRFAHPGGDVIHLDESESTILTYYRNNILHLICIPALVASFLQHNDEINEDDLVSGASLLYPFLKSEYFLRWRLESAERVVRKTIEALVGEGLLVRNGDRIARPSFSSRKFSGTNVLGRSLGQTLERYAISTVLLSQYIDKGYVDRAEFERQCQLMAQRIAILNGTHDPEFIDKGVFRNYIDLLKRLDYVDQDASEQLRVKPSVEKIASRCLSLLSVDIRQSIARITLESSN